MESQLTKSCLSCGSAKPMTAFLQINGPEGTSYGSICATCRGSSAGKAIVIPEQEKDSSGSGTGLKIDSKTKVHLDIEKKQQAQIQIEQNKEELKKREEKASSIIEQKEKKYAEEKKHRERYIDPNKKERFLNYQTKPAQRTMPFVQDRPAESVNLAHDSQEILQKEGMKQEDIDKSINLTESYIDPSQAGLAKFQSAEFQKVKAWLGEGSAIRTYERQFLSKSPISQEQKKHEVTKTTKESITEYITENFNPTSPNSRGRRR